MSTILEEVESKAYPSLERKPGKQNWVDKVGGLPSLIERVAKHLHYEKGRSISTAIATAVNWAKKMCATGTAFGGKTKVGAKAQAAACKAVAEWEAKKAKAVSEGLHHDPALAAVERLIASGARMNVEEQQAVGHRAFAQAKAAIELLETFEGEPESSALTEAMRRAYGVIVGPAAPEALEESDLDHDHAEEVRLALMEGLVADYHIAGCCGLNLTPLDEALSSADAVARTRAALAEKRRKIQARGGPKGRSGKEVTDAEFEKKHPRAAKGRVGGGQFVQKGDSGAAVKGLQRELGLSGDKLTGKYDEATVAAVKAFQREHGLQVDGVVGAQTAGLMQDQAGVAPGELASGDKAFLRSRARDVGYTKGRRKGGTLREAEIEEAMTTLRRGPGGKWQLRNRLGRWVDMPEVPEGLPDRESKRAALAAAAAREDVEAQSSLAKANLERYGKVEAHGSDPLEMVVDRYTHMGPGGDKAMPEVVRNALEAIPRGEARTIAGVKVERQRNGDWNVDGDPNLKSPWVAMQSIQMARGSYDPFGKKLREAEEGDEAKPDKPAGDTPAPELHLQSGANGERVGQMQQRLNALGYRVQEDGQFGDRTEGTIRQFQREQGLTEDGIVGEQTIDAMRQADAVQRGDLYRKGDGIVGEVNDGVRELQDTLKLAGFETEVDGRFGPETERQVRRVQRRYGLRIDGIAGPRTLALLDRIGRRSQDAKDEDDQEKDEKKDKEAVAA